MREPAANLDEYEELRALATATPAARRQHRLHAVMLVAGGQSRRRVAQLLGVSPRSVEYWVQRYRLYKYKGLADKKKSGRPPLLPPALRERVAEALSAAPPAEISRERRWTGAVFRAYLRQVHGVALGLRQAQRLLVALRPSMI